MCVLDWHLVLEFFKVILSWPPIILVVSLIFLFSFKGGIEDFIRRLVAGSALGASLQAVPPAQSGTAINSASRAALESSQPGAQTGSARVQTPAEGSYDVTGIPGGEKALAYTIANPNRAVFEFWDIIKQLNHERLFNRIFGTQLQLLEYLTAKNEPQQLSALAQFHIEHQKLSKRTDYDITNYMNFLVGFRVIKLTTDGDTHTYSITSLGTEFLSYIKAQYPTNWNERAF